MMAERLRQLVRHIEQLPREEQDAMALALQRELAAPARARSGSIALLRLRRLRVGPRRAGFTSVDAVALIEQNRAEAAQRPAS